MTDLDKFIAICKKANKTRKVYNDAFWEEQNISIGKIHKEFEERARMESAPFELLNRIFNV